MHVAVGHGGVPVDPQSLHHVVHVHADQLAGGRTPRARAHPDAGRLVVEGHTISAATDLGVADHVARAQQLHAEVVDTDAARAAVLHRDAG